MILSNKAITLYNLLSIGVKGAKTRKALAELLNADVRTVSVLSRQLINAQKNQLQKM